MLLLERCGGARVRRKARRPMFLCACVHIVLKRSTARCSLVAIAITSPSMFIQALHRVAMWQIALPQRVLREKWGGGGGGGQLSLFPKNGRIFGIIGLRLPRSRALRSRALELSRAGYEVGRPWHTY